MKSFKTIFIAAAALAACSAASAAKITGDIFFDGTVTLNGTTQTATEFVSFNNVSVAAGTQTGDYAGLDGAAVVMNGFQFDPVLAPDPVDVLWSVGGYSFVLDYLTGVYRYTVGATNFLTVTGSGWAHADGYESSAGVWSLTTQGNRSSLSFSSNTEVPDSGATLAFLGLGLIGMGAAARRFKK